MSDPDFFSRARVAILGLGLMGGSLALALRGRCKELAAFDPNAGTVSLARQMGFASRVSSRADEIVSTADIVILAAPVRAILDLIAELPAWHAGSPVLMDIGSTKSVVVQAMERLPGRFEAVGGHPMCGLAAAGLAHARAELFQGAVFAFTPTSLSGERARQAAGSLADLLGARALWLDAAEHDRWVAATSHLPYLLSLALTLATPAEAAQLVGPGFQSTTRLAGSSTAMMADILATNSANILAALGRFRIELDWLQEQLQTPGSAELVGRMGEGAARRELLLAEKSS